MGSEGEVKGENFNGSSMINVPGVSEDTDPMIQGPHVFFLRERTIAFSSFFSPPF